MAAPAKPYTPVITEAQPVTEKQKRLAAEGYRAFWVEASGNSYKNGLRVTRYLVTLMPDGYLKCPCESGKTGKGCRHKSAVHSHVGSPRTTNIIAAKPEGQRIMDEMAIIRATMTRQADAPVATKVTVAAGPQMTFACARPAKPDRRDTAMPAYAGESRFDPLTGMLREDQPFFREQYRKFAR